MAIAEEKVPDTGLGLPYSSGPNLSWPEMKRWFFLQKYLVYQELIFVSFNHIFSGVDEVLLNFKTISIRLFYL